MKGRPLRDNESCEIFADNLDRIMKEKRCLNIHLAEDTGLAEATISRLRNGKQYPSGLTLKKICSVLDISMTELVE